MHSDYEAIVIGSGLGGLTAGALFTHAGHRVLVPPSLDPKQRW